MKHPLTLQERALRSAISRRQYNDVPAHMAELRRIADLEIAADPASRREIAAWALSTIEWAEQMIANQHRIWRQESEQIPHMSRYLSDAADQTPNLSVTL